MKAQCPFCNTEFDYTEYPEITIPGDNKLKKRILNKSLYKEYETSINDIIRSEQGKTDESRYYIVPDTVVSMDDDEKTQKNNQYHVFTKSFIVGTDYQE